VGGPGAREERGFSGELRGVPSDKATCSRVTYYPCPLIKWEKTMRRLIRVGVYVCYGRIEQGSRGFLKYEERSLPLLQESIGGIRVSHER